MKKLRCLMVVMLWVLTAGITNGFGAESMEELIFSEYIEGSGNNKALEIFNGTGNTIDLGQYTVEAYHNGSSAPTYTIPLEGTLPTGDVFVICNPNAAQSVLDAADMETGSINFNGDDAIVLINNTKAVDGNNGIIDSIGRIGTDPGSAWGSGDVTTKDHTLIRLASVSAGDQDPSDDFDPSSEWDARAKDDFSNLGSHGDGNQEPSPVPAFIHEVQGYGTVSPVAGQEVTIEGIVVGDFQENDQMKGFFVQEEDADADDYPATSEGIFIYHTLDDVNVGDLVKLTGVAGEYYENTQIKNLSSLTVISSGNPLPAPAEIRLPFSDKEFMERYEGMYALFPQALTVNENYNLGRYGELVLSNGRLWNPTNIVEPGEEAVALQAENDLNRIILDDGSTKQNPDPVIHPAPGLDADNTVRSGDTVQSLKGVINYSYNEYRVQPTETPEFVPANERVGMPDTVGGTLRVASFNVLNYFTTLDDGNCPYEGGCRGADSAEEFERQKAKIVQAMLAVDADIFGLMEMENHPEDASLEDLVNGLNEAAGDAVYAYIHTGAVGTDAIKVALIYKSETVSPVGTYAVLDATVDPDFIDTKNRPALAQTFREKKTKEIITVVVNHLKSKGSSCEDIGDPDTGDCQGNCNQTRTAAARAIVNWLAGDPTKSNDPDFLVIGDMNAYAMEDPIAEFETHGYTNLIDRFIGYGAYSYVYDGQAGYLDHALSSESLTDRVTGVTEWHINCDEPKVLDYNTEYKSDTQLTDFYSDSVYRASDHDPVIIGLNLSSEKTSEICSSLGDNRFRFIPDIDIYMFKAGKGDKVTITLKANENGTCQGKRARLTVTDAFPGYRLLKTRTGALPNQIKAELPGDGWYIISVSEMMTVKKKNRFSGDYCISLSSESDVMLIPVNSD